MRYVTDNGMKREFKPGWDDYLIASTSVHDGCPCTMCERWRENQVEPGALCVPFLNRASSAYPQWHNFCYAWELGRYDPDRLHEKLTPMTPLLCLAELYNSGVMPPSSVIVLKCDGTVCATSKMWLTVIAKPDNSI